MIDLYSWSTPNGYKAQIKLEETVFDYRLHPVDLGQAGYFIHRAAEPVPAAVERFTLETERLYRVVEREFPTLKSEE